MNRQFAILPPPRAPMEIPVPAWPGDDIAQPPKVVGAEGLNIAFCQGRVTACAHICVAIAARLVRREAAMLAPHLVVDTEWLAAAGRTGLESYRAALRKRQRETPDDKSKFFTAGRAVWRAAERMRAAGAEPFWDQVEHSGYFLVRGEVPPDANCAVGFTPSLIDAVEEAWRRAQTTGKYHAMVITDSSEYTRLAIFAPAHAWFYDSHGSDNSTLYWFGDRIEWLLVHMLRKSGFADEEQLAVAQQQYRDPSLRHSVPFETTTDFSRKRYELVLLWAK